MFKSFLVSLQFLTRIPIKRDLHVTDDCLSKSMVFFPIVGGLIGGIQILILLVTYRVFSSLIIALLLLLTPIVLTGAFHIEGFVDMVDGFLSRKDRDETLRIMKDSHIGAMGVIGAICLMLTKFIFLEEIIRELSLLGLVGILLFVPSFSRWAMVIAASVSGYARDAGLGRPFTEGANKQIVFLSGIVPIVASIIFLKIYSIVGIGLTILASMAISSFSKHKIGGITGDVLGAINEITEIALLLSVIVMLKFLK